MDQREAFLYWWPVVARACGILGAFVQAGFAAATHQSADVAFLGFCTGLIAAPTVFPTKDGKTTTKGREDGRNRKEVKEGE